MTSINPAETVFVGEELEVYNGVPLQPGDFVVDTGANQWPEHRP